ncbi:MAG: SDR family NAD(P)-dependent oxidoreductase, partial [Acidobacteria bacterium]|nr:SDR family NAD(P)-dependent oxidoreductase [Acidobacteriota bacterium]
MALPLAGKTALVTGSAKGIGRGIALELARRGCDVAVNDYKDEAGAQETARLISELGRRSVVVMGDVGSAADVDEMFRTTVQSFGRLHILVNNAGIQTWKPLLDLEEQEWDRVIRTN